MGVKHYSVETYHVENSIGYLLQQVRTCLGDTLNDELADLGISWAQWKVLIRIHFGDKPTSANLCRGLEMDTGSMTRMLDRLEEKGLISRNRCIHDRRVIYLALTDAGRAMVPDMLEAVVTVLNDLLEDFSVEEVELFKSMIRRILANAEKRPKPHE
ncbi:MAG: MarR family transcriptional regulator [Burkholderiales bacterium]|nr:MarR family transcriptional regulator [Burkholderiales bacterium]